MRLLVSPTSHFSRKVRIVLFELDLLDSTEIITVDPLAHDAVLLGANPLSKVPALILPDGRALFDSYVICDHLDRSASSRLIPPDGRARDNVLVVHAVATGIMDATFAVVTEKRRPETERSKTWQSRWDAAIERAVDVLKPDQCLERPRDLGEIAIAVALAHLDYRLPEIGWRSRNPLLAKWYGKAEQWDAMRATPLPVA